MRTSIGRTIPAFVIQGWLQEILNAAQYNEDSDTALQTIEAAEDMGLLKVNKCDEQGRAIEIEWLKVN